jgi:hypothetical protein
MNAGRDLPDRRHCRLSDIDPTQRLDVCAFMMNSEWQDWPPRQHRLA